MSGKSSSSSISGGHPTTSYSTQAQQNSGVYSFSVHQPYTNWPLSTPSASSYASWYPLAQQSFASSSASNAPPAKSYKDEQIDTKDLYTVTPPTGKEGQESRYRPEWNKALSTFFRAAGLFEALSGFQTDMLVMNEEWEREQIPEALQALVKDLLAIMYEPASSNVPEKPLVQKKLEAVNPQNGVELQTPSTLTKSVSRLLAQTRRRNDISNRSEFLQSVSEKRRDGGPSPTSEDVAMGEGESSQTSCARADARPQNRELQMKYDIAKNEDGPLKRTLKGRAEDKMSHQESQKRDADCSQVKSEYTVDKHPGLLERFTNFETHLAVRFVPSPPRSLTDRIRFLETHIIALEKNFPPWAALHFNQPNRGWPPPPRVTPIIVPSHLTSSEADNGGPGSAAGSSDPSVGASRAATSGQAKGKSGRTKSSLHRAVMEKLEVQRALGDLAEGANTPG